MIRGRERVSTYISEWLPDTTPIPPLWNPSDKSANILLFDDNASALAIATAWKTVRADTSKAAGKWYFEIEVIAGSAYNMIGVTTSALLTSNYVGSNATSWSYYGYNGYKWTNAGSTAFGATFTVGNVIGCAVDIDAGKIWWAKDNAWQAAGDPASGANPAFTGLAGTLFQGLSPYNLGNYVTLMSSPSDCIYAPPSGFLVWKR